jgi:hypothetical protein
MPLSAAATRAGEIAARETIGLLRRDGVPETYPFGL